MSRTRDNSPAARSLRDSTNSRVAIKAEPIHATTKWENLMANLNIRFWLVFFIGVVAVEIIIGFLYLVLDANGGLNQQPILRPILIASAVITLLGLVLGYFYGDWRYRNTPKE